MSRTKYFAICWRTAISLAFAMTIGGLSLRGQDTRTVKEPVLPPACVKLQAAMTTASAISGEMEARANTAGSDRDILDTARIQQALDHCETGHAVELAGDENSAGNSANSAFLIGPIFLRSGVTLLVDKGVTLYGTRNPEYYAVTPGSCGVVSGDSSRGCKPLITVRRATGSAIMGDGTIDGQGGARLVVDGKVSAKTWWDLAEDARGVGKLRDDATRQQAPRMIDTDLTDDFTLYGITLKNSPNFHVVFHRGDGFTVWGIKIDTPKTARNTDGIDPAQSSNITITHSSIRDGDDNIAIKAGDGPTTNMTISHNHFYWGHGMTIGSDTNGGVSGIRVQDLSLDGPDNGIHIKSDATRGGVVEDVIYEDICIRGSKYPILFDSAYSFPGKGANQLPVYTGIELRNVRIAGGGKIQFNGFDHTHRVSVRLDGVLALDSSTLYKSQAIHTDLTFGPGPVDLIFSGDDSTVNGKGVNGNLPGCASKFVPFP